ncbi:DUF4381 domain-containing protein [Candidatus Magnetaquicoccus inordinatus]|uniref:DUF4381 domain-containing protein n=1 Tax=Candidatus Magnetaquicoccus inordinatus TaxID=2496818 RepID=UPI00187D61D4|nr:DUF4381 domain-containing protein [Candidatus Magnetaquicoccus inordinatus]
MADPSPLNGLRPIHLPDPPSWWPPAPGWIIVLVSLLLALIMVRLFWRQRRMTRLRRLALQELHNLQQAYQQHQQDQQLVSDLSLLLRRVAMHATAEPQQRSLAALTGEAWLHFLDQNHPQQPFQTGIGRVLLSYPFQNPAGGITPLSMTERSALLALCQRWLYDYSLPGRLTVTP